MKASVVHFDRLKTYLGTSAVSWWDENAEEDPEETAKPTHVAPTIVTNPILE